MKAKKSLIVVGPRVLISPDKGGIRTDAGLYLPPTVKEKEEVQGGFIVKTGPGYPIPDTSNILDEPWLKTDREHKYLPLQACEGDYTLFLKKEAVDIEFENEKYLIVPHTALLALVRTEIVDKGY